LGLITGVIYGIFHIWEARIEQIKQFGGCCNKGSICGVSHVNPYNFTNGMAFGIIDKVNPC
jgi:hypothetical protein